MKKIWFFFYGLPNIVGLAMALLGLVVHLLMALYSPRGGIMLWPLIVLGLYITGWLVGWMMQGGDAGLHFRQTVTAEEIKDALNTLIRKTRRRLPREAFKHVENIRSAVMSVLPEIVSGNFANQDLYTVKQTVFDYLPETLESYIKLPAVYANFHTLRQGKTAKQLLIEQLEMIDDTMQSVVKNIYEKDTQALLVNQRFLESRLGQPKALFT